MKFKYHSAILFGTVTFALAGCGGGGGSTSSALPAPGGSPGLAVPFQAAFANLAQNGFSGTFTISGWVNNSSISDPQPNTPVAGSGTFTMGPAQAGTFTSGPLSGSAELQQVEVIYGTINENAYSATEDIWYNPSNYSILGTWDATNGSFYYSQYTPPISVRAGDTGSLGGPTYSVAADSASTLLVTITSNLNTVGGAVQTQTAYRIDTAGNVSFVSIASQNYFDSTEYQSLTFTF